MKKFRISSTFFAMLAVALIAFSCNENEDDPITPTGDAPNNASGLMATAGSNSSVILKWTAPVVSSSATLDSYELTYTPAGTTPISIAKGQTSYTVTGLAVGTVYQFTLKSKGTNNKLSSGVSISWAPARRSAAIKLYGSAASEGSGLDFDGETGGMPKVLTIANGGQWDLTFDDKGTRPVIGSPGQSLYVDDNFEFPNGQEAKKTLVSQDRTLGITGLDQVFETGALVPGDAERVHFLDNANNQPFAFVVKTKEGNFAKVLVLANGGQIIHGSGSNAYIEVVVSYQPTVNVPYALPSGPRNSNEGWTTQRRPDRSGAVQTK